MTRAQTTSKQPLPASSAPCLGCCCRLLSVQAHNSNITHGPPSPFQSIVRPPAAADRTDQRPDRWGGPLNECPWVCPEGSCCSLSASAVDGRTPQRTCDVCLPSHPPCLDARLNRSVHSPIFIQNRVWGDIEGGRIKPFDQAEVLHYIGLWTAWPSGLKQHAAQQSRSLDHHRAQQQPGKDERPQRQHLSRG